MTMRKDGMAIWMGVLLSMAAGVATAGDGGDQGQAALRSAYLKAAGRAVDGLPATTLISSVDQLGDHHIALYTVDGSHKDVWLVTTDAACVQPRLEGDRIVEANAQGEASACRSVRIQSVDQRELAAQLMSLPSGQASAHETVLVYPVTLREFTAYRTDVMTDGGRTR
ncbi:hypothetical protein DVT68_17900 [Dyella solisilvae]|uniref:Peptidase n=1 Tax=Dyella solisilvae TaxID=1920168 RepID=A0A370K473_9GAMM|nr:hypothetical protein [Dyella solisilvae]RDI97227.1 hypothetical protein DVT68_17900 [Dyella solisilvae]